jgi:hypothetical protein
LPHKFSYIVAILGHSHFESPNSLEKWRKIYASLFFSLNGGGARNLKKATTTKRFSKWEESELAVIDIYPRNKENPGALSLLLFYLKMVEAPKIEIVLFVGLGISWSVFV